MYDTKPRYYVCEQDGCRFQGQVRPVWARKLTNGFAEWPELHCECSPEVQPRRVVPGWVQDQIDFTGTEPCS